MGVEASFQAMPEYCDLMIAARRDREIAENILFFNLYMVRTTRQWTNLKWVEFYEKAKKVFQERPGLGDRYFHAGNRTFDAIVYLLSPARRAIPRGDDTSLIYQAIYGQEDLHPEARAGQGGPIRLVPTAAVAIIATYLNQITVNILHEHYDGKRMSTNVYKMQDHDEERFLAIWEEFIGMREVYRAAAEHGEAVITVIE